MISKKKVVVVGGCFDILHAGHIQFLNESKKLGEKLVVLLESDSNVKKLKGNNRPVNKLKVRTENLFKTDLVDVIVPLASKVNDNYYSTIVKSINPDIIAITKGDPLEDKKKQLANLVGAKLIIATDRNIEFSTTKIVEKSKNI